MLSLGEALGLIPSNKNKLLLLLHGFKISTKDYLISESNLSITSLHSLPYISKKKESARHQWLTPIILDSHEAEIRRIMV
jgi:hypothetical protein